MMQLTLLPARYGDALWLEYGDSRQPHVVIIDCGFKENYRALVARLSDIEPEQLELLVLTHIDEDHIKGAIPLLADVDRFRPHKDFDIWFNGWQHLPEPSDVLGAKQGEYFSALILQRGFNWNAASPWKSGAVVVPESGPLPSGKLAGGLRWTLLSPTLPKLAALREFWLKELAHKDLAPGDHEAFLALFSEQRSLQPDLLGSADDLERLAEAPFIEDTKAPNGSSIALLLEYEQKSLLLTGDAHPSVLTASLRRLSAERGQARIKVDACKISHHGSGKNTSNNFLQAIDCRRFLFSTSGEKFGHPSPECVARVICHRRDGVSLAFNYDCDHTRRWKDAMLQRRLGFNAGYAGADGYTLTL